MCLTAVMQEQYESETSYSYSIGRSNRERNLAGAPPQTSASKNQRPPENLAASVSAQLSRGRRDYRLGLGVVLCAELGVSVPRTFVIMRTSTRRFLARPSALVLGATYLSLPIPIR